MKHIITAKGNSDVNRGSGSFTGGNPLTQTESATELIITRLAAISYYKDNIINKDTIVLTLPERKFLYEHIFENVEVYDSTKYYDLCMDLVTQSQLDNLCSTIPYKPFYKNFERDKNELLNINYNQEILNKKLPDFMVCIPRLKNSDTRRNLDISYWEEFLKISKEKYERIFVFGKGNDQFNDEQVTYVDTLLDYCSYLHHENCVDIVSTISGPCHFAQSFSNSALNTKLTMIDNFDLIGQHGNDPSYFHPCLNFTKIPINFVKELVSPQELLNILKK